MSKNYYEIGALDRSDFRSALHRLKFYYGDLDWTEDKGWISSIFYVTGNNTAIIKLNQMVDYWNSLNK